MDEREFAEFYQRYCAECESGGVEPLSPDAVAELLTDLSIYEPDVQQCWLEHIHHDC